MASYLERNAFLVGNIWLLTLKEMPSLRETYGFLPGMKCLPCKKQMASYLERNVFLVGNGWLLTLNEMPSLWETDGFLP